MDAFLVIFTAAVIGLLMIWLDVKVNGRLDD